MKKLFFPVVVLLILATAVGITSAAEKLRVGSDMTYPPFEFVDEKTRQPAGFDIDFIKAVGEAMGVDIELMNVAWDGIIPGLLAGHYDMLISAMTITEERAQAIDFTDPYFATGQVIAVRKGNKTHIPHPWARFVGVFVSILTR